MFTRKGKVFGKNTIRGILTNEKYKGWNVRNKYNTGLIFHKYTNAKIRDKSEWIIHNDEKTKEKIPPIVSEEDFDKVQELLEGKREHKLNIGKYHGISEFASRIVCGNCGAVYYANNDNGRRFYNCSTKKRDGISKCNNKNVTLKKIDERICVENYRKDIYQANIYFSQILVLLIHKLVNSIDEDASEKVIQLKEELNILEQRKRRIVDIYTNGDIDETDYTERITPLLEQIKKIEKEIYQTSKSNDEINEDLIQVKETLNELKQEFKSLLTQSLKDFKKNHTRDIIVKNIRKIIVKENGELEIEYNIFNKYFKLVEKHKHLLDVYTVNNDYDKATKLINSRVEAMKQDILKKVLN